MINQFELVPRDSPAPMILYWMVIFIVSLGLIDSRSLNRKKRITLYLTTLIIAGVILGGIPHVVLPIEYTLTTIASGGGLISVLHPLAICTVIIAFSFVVGRVFCGYGCPVGVIQELISQINFPSDFTKYQKNTTHVEISSRISTRIRWIYFCVLIITSIIGFNLVSVTSPMSVFLFIMGSSLVSMIVISILSIFLYRPWCRFFCPFGAASAFCSQFATIKYRRTDDCTECGDCEITCPTQEAFDHSKKGECYFCNRCIEVCPQDAIKYDLDI